MKIKICLIIVGLFLIAAVPPMQPMQFDYYLPAIWQEQGPELPAFRNVRNYGALGDGITDDTEAIQKAIDLGPGIVYFPPGDYAVSQSLVVSGNGVMLQGSGTGWVAYMYGYPPDKDVSTNVKWIGELHGTLLKIGDSIEPNAGCAIRDIALDGNERATTLLMADATFYLRVDNLMGYGWRDGFGIVITHTAGVRGSGEKYHTWDHITLVNPHENGSGLDIAPAGSLNVNQVTITSCNIARSNVDDPTVTSLRLGYADHIAFNRCTFIPNSPAYLWQDRQLYNPYAITVEPIEGHEIFPMNITFYGSSMYGGINYTGGWQDTGLHALLFYPFYSADWQLVPPAGFIGGSRATLPYNLVGGFTDQGNTLP